MEKSKTRQDMAKEYGVDRKTFYLMLKRMNVSIPPGLILPIFQELIYTRLGEPRKARGKGVVEKAVMEKEELEKESVEQE